MNDSDRKLTAKELLLEYETVLKDTGEYICRAAKRLYAKLKTAAAKPSGQNRADDSDESDVKDGAE